jgi:hypothetical protein
MTERLVPVVQCVVPVAVMPPMIASLGRLRDYEGQEEGRQNRPHATSPSIPGLTYCAFAAGRSKCPAGQQAVGGNARTAHEEVVRRT